jgi:hypothetical protein
MLSTGSSSIKQGNFSGRKDPLKTAFAALQAATTERTMEGSQEENHSTVFQPGTPIVVEVMSFGPLGASVHVIGLGHLPESLLAEHEPPMATGLILQKEIHFYRQSRNHVDVLQGEVLPAYVERVRDMGGAVPKLDICLRVFGGKAKAEEASARILERLQEVGEMPIGDKSPREDIARQFPGMSKIAFKKAVGSLFDQKKVWPSAHSIRLYNEADGLSKRK